MGPKHGVLKFQNFVKCTKMGIAFGIWISNVLFSDLEAIVFRIQIWVQGSNGIHTISNFFLHRFNVGGQTIEYPVQSNSNVCNNPTNLKLRLVILSRHTYVSKAPLLALQFVVYKIPKEQWRICTRIENGNWFFSLCAGEIALWKKVPRREINKKKMERVPSYLFKTWLHTWRFFFRKPTLDIQITKIEIIPRYSYKEYLKVCIYLPTGQIIITFEINTNVAYKNRKAVQETQTDFLSSYPSHRAQRVVICEI